MRFIDKSLQNFKTTAKPSSFTILSLDYVWQSFGMKIITNLCTIWHKLRILELKRIRLTEINS